MDEREYLEALRGEQERSVQKKRDDALNEALIHEASVNRINQEYRASQGGGHGGAIAGVIIMLILGVAAWMYFH